jgi:hypothetical protein
MVSLTQRIGDDDKAGAAAGAIASMYITVAVGLAGATSATSALAT